MRTPWRLAVAALAAALAACVPDGSPTAIPVSDAPLAPTAREDFSCGDVSEIPLVECNALVAVYTTTNGNGWLFNNGWLDSNSPCVDWNVLVDFFYRHRVSCSGGRVQVLQFRNNNLAGSLPREIGDFEALEILTAVEFDPNTAFGGSIPSEIGSLSNLEFLQLLGRFTGSIPGTIGNLANLTDLGLCCGITGQIPAGLGELSQLRAIGLAGNALSGSIPSTLGSLSKLEVLTLNNNQLSGSIPPEIGDATSLQSLLLYANQLSGSIPAELGNLVQLVNLTLRQNQLSGAIPAALGNLQQLRVLGLQQNQLTGSIPGALGALSSLQVMALSQNQLSGPIPPDLGGLSSLVAVSMSDNQLSGSIPAELGSLAALLQLDLSDNQLQGLVPLPVAVLGGKLQTANPSFCDLTSNPGLFMPDFAEYRAADLDGDGLICGVPLGTPVPEAILASLAAQIQTLVDAGFLTQGQGTALLAKLEAAQRALGAGPAAPQAGPVAAAPQADDTRAAALLNAFVRQVNSLVAEAVLSAAQGGVLIAQVELALAGLA